jgi:hypothetical protein
MGKSGHADAIRELCEGIKFSNMINTCLRSRCVYFKIYSTATMNAAVLKRLP